MAKSNKPTGSCWSFTRKQRPLNTYFENLPRRADMRAGGDALKFIRFIQAKEISISFYHRNPLKSEDSGKLYVTKAGFSSGFNYLGTVNNIKEQGPCQGLFSGVPTLPPPFWGCDSHGRDSGYVSVPAMTAC
jgi:hypothetical protein